MGFFSVKSDAKDGGLVQGTFFNQIFPYFCHFQKWQPFLCFRIQKKNHLKNFMGYSNFL